MKREIEKTIKFNEEQIAYIEKYFGPIAEIPEEKAKEVVEEIISNDDVKVTYATWWDEAEIHYTVEEEDFQ